MATITSAGSGLASATSTWVGGVVPVEGDKVIIAAGHVVTIDGTFTWGDDNFTATIGTAAVSVSGTLKASRSVNSSLTVKGLLLCNYATKALDYGTDADPIPASITAQLILNKSDIPSYRVGLQQVTAPVGAGNFIDWSFVGDNTRKRGMYLSGNGTAGNNIINLTESDHGWSIGDEVMFFHTSNTVTTSQIEFFTISGISGAQITLSGNLAYTHLSGSPVCNITANVIITSHTVAVGKEARIALDNNNLSYSYATLGYKYVFKNVALNGLGSGQNLGMFNCSANPSGPNKSLTIYRCPLINKNKASNTSVFNLAFGKLTVVEECPIYAGFFHYGYGATKLLNSWCAVTFYIHSGGGQFYSVEGSWLVGYGAGAQLGGLAANATFTNCTMCGFGTSIQPGFGSQFINCDIGYSFGWKSNYGDKFFRSPTHSATIDATIKDCLLDSDLVLPESPANLGIHLFANVRYVNKNRNVTQQEIYTHLAEIKRNNTTKNRSASSISIKPIVTGSPETKTSSIPCANGKTIRVVGYVQFDSSFYNSGDYTAPTVSLSGLGATTQTFTASSAANGAWEKFDLSITNTAGYDGNFTLTYTASAKTVTTGTVYFDGVPDAPFVTQCRHYGFDLSQETSPTRTVDPYVSATESTAAAYTGITINGSTKRITFGAGTGDTAQKFYDYSRAWACLNLDKDIPLSRVGALFGLTSGWTVVDPTYTGMTCGGGTVEWNSNGTKIGSFDSNTHDFKAAGTYNFANSTFSGTINLVNSSGDSVTVQLPAGTSYTNTGPNITVSVYVVQAQALVSDIVPGSRLQIYNVTTATEMVNQIVSGTSYSLSYNNGTGYSADDVVRVRLTYCSGTTAKLPAEYNTIAMTSGWSVLAAQVNDDVYIANGIDGSTVTEYSSDYVNVQIDVSDPDGVTSFQRGYAWYCDQMTGDDGIRYFYGAMVAEDAFNYLLNTDVADIKIQNTGTTGVTLTGGAVRRKDGSSPIAPGGSVYIYYGRTYGLEMGTSGLTPTEADKLLSLPDAAGVWSHPTRTLTSGGTAPTAAENADAVLAALNATTIPVNVVNETNSGLLTIKKFIGLQND